VLLLIAALYLGPLYQTEYIPISENLWGNLRSMILPSISVALPLAAVTLQMTRTTMLEALSEPHIIMARAKGISERRIAYAHALKNAAPSILTLVAFLFGILIGGLVVVETVYNLPGIGRGMITAINERDFQLLVPNTVILALAFVLANTLVEVLHPVIDPRVRHAS
jgi:peptide/nickel transport system permease protein